MKMLDANHGGLYYPQEPRLLQQQSQPIASTVTWPQGLPTALLLPHAAWEHSLGVLHTALSLTASLRPSLILLLAPYHGGERNQPLWVPASDGLTLPDRSFHFAADLRNTLVAEQAAVGDDEPFVDEPSWELLLPLINAYHPTVPILPILSAERTAEYANGYAALLSRITNMVSDTLVIITANANHPLSSPRAEDHARLFLSLLTGQEDVGTRGSSTCNMAALRAVAKQRWFTNKQWRIINTAVRGTVFGQILLDEHEKHVWQVSAILEPR